MAEQDISQLPQALEILQGLQSASDLYNLARRTRIVVSKFWGGPGGSALLGRVNLPPWVRDCSAEQLVPLLVHELTHVQQGVFLFGSIAVEREAFIRQRRSEIELLQRKQPLPKELIARKKAELAILEGNFASAKAFITGLAPYYAHFPDTPPKWWQIHKWWPQVAFALKMAINRQTYIGYRRGRR